MLNNLLDEFKGKLTSSKWAKTAKCSQYTTGHNITDLMGHGLLVKEPAGGRSTSYTLHISAWIDLSHITIDPDKSIYLPVAAAQ